MQYELYHHGIKGQKWGIRRFQNPDGTLTKDGKQRYSGASSEQKDMLDANKKLLNEAMKRSTEGLQKKGDSESKPEELKTETVSGKTEINKSVSEMSDKELAAVLQRVNNERNLQQALDALYSNAKKNSESTERITLDKPDKMTSKQMKDAIEQMKSEQEYRKELNTYLASKKSFSAQVLNAGKVAAKAAILAGAGVVASNFVGGFMTGFGEGFAKSSIGSAIDKMGPSEVDDLLKRLEAFEKKSKK